MTPWLSVVGIGEDGLAGLSANARLALDSAEILIGGKRHLAMVPPDGRERLSWPTPLAKLADRIPEMRGRRVCVLATGDPMHFGIGTTLAENIAPDEMTVLPGVSAFALAAARLGWPLEHTTCLSLHARPVEALGAHLAPGARLIMLTSDATTSAKVAKLLSQQGFGDSRMVALGNMGGARESRTDAVARSWDAEVPDLNTLAVECAAAPHAVWYPRTGLPDEAFEHDGQLTKREFRALALDKLMPHQGALLWDIGAGCGSIAIEWMRAAERAHAIALEPSSERRAIAKRNAAALGVPQLEVIAARAPTALAKLRTPDAVFIGGGLSAATIAEVQRALRPGGRLVTHAVTLQSEVRLLAAHEEHGGELVRLAVQRAGPLGKFKAWRPAMPVTQWAWRKT